MHLAGNYGRSGWPFTISVLFHHLKHLWFALDVRRGRARWGYKLHKIPHALWRAMCATRITIFDILKCVLIRSTSCRKCFISMSAIVNTRRLEIWNRPKCCRSPASETHRASRRLAAHCRAAPWRSADPPIALRISLSSSKRTICLCFLIFSWRLSNILALSSILNSSASRRCDALCIYCMSLLLSSSSFSNRSCSWLISARTSRPCFTRGRNFC